MYEDVEEAAPVGTSDDTVFLAPEVAMASVEALMGQNKHSDFPIFSIVMSVKNCSTLLPAYSVSIIAIIFMICSNWHTHIEYPEQVEYVLLMLDVGVRKRSSFPIGC